MSTARCNRASTSPWSPPLAPAATMGTPSSFASCCSTSARSFRTMTGSICERSAYSSVRITSLSGPASAKPAPTAQRVVSLPCRYETRPVRSAASSGRWPGSTPNSPLTLGAVTSSTLAESARPRGVTISSWILSTMAPLSLGRQLRALLLGLGDVADHVEGLLGQVVELALDDLLEAVDRLLEGDVLALGPREAGGDEERLRQEALHLARAGDDELVFFAELVHAEDRDDVL